MFKSLYLLRHGRTVANHTKRLVGQTHSPLLPRSLEYSKKIGEFLSDIPFDVFFLSPIQRAIETYHLMGLKKVDKFLVDPRLAEINCGEYEGLMPHDPPPEFWQKMKADPYSTVWPGGESFQMIEKRVLDFLEEIKTSCTGKTVGILSHWGPSGMIAASLMGWRFKGVHDPWFQPNNSIYKYENGQMSFKVIGEMDGWYDGH